MNIKTTSTAKLEAESAANTIAYRLTEATARRDALSAEIDGLDAAVDGAEIAHAVALAGVELGEAADTVATAAALDEANKAALRKPELIQQRRTADAVIDGLTRRYAEAHASYVAAVEQHKAEQVERVTDRCQQAMDAAIEAVAELRNRVAEAQAARRVLDGLDAGNRWTFGWINIDAHTFSTDHAAVELMAAALHNEIA